MDLIKSAISALNKVSYSTVNFLKIKDTVTKKFAMAEKTLPFKSLVTTLDFPKECSLRKVVSTIAKSTTTVAVMSAMFMATTVKFSTSSDSTASSNSPISIGQLEARAEMPTVPIAHGSTGQFHTASGISINFDPRFLKNGSKIFGVRTTPSDVDTMVQIIGGLNGDFMIKLLGSNRAVSVANNMRHGSWLEVWDFIPGTYTQVFKAIPVGNGGYYLALAKDPTMAINLDGGRNQGALSLNKIILVNGKPDPEMVFYFTDINDNRRDNHQKFGTTQKPDGKLLTGSCSSYTQGCLPTGYNGYDNTWSFGASGMNNDGTWHNCTAFAAWWLQANGQGHPGVNLGNANTWGVRAQNAGMVVRTQPVVGSVGVVESGSFGHVFVVSQINQDGTMWIMEDNFSWTRGYSSRRLVSKNYGTKFIVPPTYR
jgi:surface antigen